MSAEQTSAIRFSCQTYAWQMSGTTATSASFTALRRRRRPSAGFAGLEPEPVMLGRLLRTSAAAHAVHRRELASSCPPSRSWRRLAFGPSRPTQERACGGPLHPVRLQSFPGEARMLLVQAPGARPRGPAGAAAERDRAASTRSHRRARRRGGRDAPASTPNSPAGSVFRDARATTTSSSTDSTRATSDFTPDVGHIAKGGMDPLEIVRTYRRSRRPHPSQGLRRRRVAANRRGVDRLRRDRRATCATPATDGWIVVEDESRLGRRADPDERHPRDWPSTCTPPSQPHASRVREQQSMRQ